MSGPTVSRALQDRFEAVRRAELKRLKRKLAGLSAEDRRSAEAITAHVVSALALAPVQALTNDPLPHALEAVVRLFALDID